MKTYQQFINEKYVKAAKAAAKVVSNLSKYSKVKPLSGIKPKSIGQLYQGMKVKPLKPGTKIIDKLDARIQKSPYRVSNYERSPNYVKTDFLYANRVKNKTTKQLGSKTIGGEKVGEVLPKSKMPKFDYEKELLKKPGMKIEKMPYDSGRTRRYIATGGGDSKLLPSSNQFNKYFGEKPIKTNIIKPKKPIRFDTGGSLSSKPKIDKATGERISLKGYKNLYPSKIKKVKGATFGDKVLYSKQGKPFDKAIKQERLPMPKPYGKAKNVVGQKGVKETIPTTPKTTKLDPFPKISNPNRKPFTPSTLSKSKQELKKLTDPQKRSKMLKLYQKNTFNARQGKMTDMINRPESIFYSPSKRDIRNNPLMKRGDVYDKFGKVQKDSKPYSRAKDKYQISKAEKTGKNPIKKKVALDKLSTQYRARHTFRKGNPKYSRDVADLSRQQGGNPGVPGGGGEGTIGKFGTAAGTGGGYYGKGNKARRRLGLNVKEREYPTQLQKTAADTFGDDALSKKDSIARSQRRKAGTPTMRDLDTKTTPRKRTEEEGFFDFLKTFDKKFDDAGKKISKSKSDSSIKKIQKSKIHKMDQGQIKKKLDKDFKDSPD